MLLPPATTEEVSPVSIKLLPSSDYYEYFIIVNETVRPHSLIKSCSGQESIELWFELYSDILGSNEEKIVVPIQTLTNG